MKIGFIGTGVMGNSIGRHLLEGGHELSVYTRTAKKAEDLLEQGASWKNNPKELAADAEVIFTMVGYPSDVQEIYFGENGLLANAAEGTVLIDLTTSQPKLAQEIADAARAKGLHALDAPVSGGDIGAKNAVLSVMVGGEEEVFNRLLPLFRLFAGNIILQGPAGSGQHTKMCNQINIANNMLGVCESLIYAKKAGLDPENVLRSISAGAAGSWSLSNLAPKMIEGDFRPGFYIKHFIKDMKIAVEESERWGLDLPGLKLSLGIYEELERAGDGDLGTQALIRHFDFAEK